MADWSAFDAKTEPVPPLVATPTNAPGGMAKLTKIWERLRELNIHGYCPGTLISSKWGPEKVDPEKLPWDDAKERTWKKSGDGLQSTTCTPMLSQAIAMLFDKRAEPSSDAEAVYEPYLGDGRRLPYNVSLLLNGNGDHRPGWGAGKALRYYGLAERVDPKKMRRGDVIGIQWAKGGGHGVFVWDVHLNAAGDVDCFQMISAIGSYKYPPAAAAAPAAEGEAAAPAEAVDEKGKKKKEKKPPPIGGSGAGITIGSPDDLVKAKMILLKKGTQKACYVDGSKGRPTYELAADALPLFIGKKDEYSILCKWTGIPGVKAGDIDLETFVRPPGTPAKAKVRVSYGKIAFMECARLYGLGEVPSYATCARPDETRAGGAPKIPGAVPKETSAVDSRDANALANLPKQPLEQERSLPAKEQKLVEERLFALWKVGRLETDPGKPDEIMDAKSQAALKEFQEKAGLTVRGFPDKATRDALAEAVKKAKAEVEGFDQLVARPKRAPPP